MYATFVTYKEDSIIIRLLQGEHFCQRSMRGVCPCIRSVLPEAIVVQVPLSDGGEGQVECVRQMLPTRSVSVGMHGPLMKPIEAQYALSADGTTAYMEMAAASGLTLVPSSLRNPLNTTTYVWLR